MRGCFSLMLVMEDIPVVGWDAAKVKSSPIDWIAMNHTKPGRDPDVGTVVIHSSSEWAEHHIDGDREQLRSQLLQEFSRVTGVAEEKVVSAKLHRWRFASTAEPASEACFIDELNGLAACGDWCLEGRVESAYLSASCLSDALMNQKERA